jgi:predicted hydrocarbon binding protein
MFQLRPEYVEYLDTFKNLGVRPFSEENILRKKLGDYVSILILRDILYSILLLSPRVYTPFLYSWGKFIGCQAAKQGMKTLNVTFATKLLAKFGSLNILNIDIYREALTKGFVSIRSSIPELTYLDEKAGVFRIKTEECDEAWGMKVSKKICFFEGAIMAGSTECILDKNINVIETKCVAHGDKFCEFLFNLSMKFPQLEILDKKYFRKIKFEIMESLISKKVLRKRLGDLDHIASLQVTYLGLWLSSPGSHALLYWIGRETGKELSKKLRGSLRKLSEFFKDKKLGILEIEKKNGKLMFIEKECAFSSGAKNFEKRICSYTAGLIAGFLKSRKGVNVVETKCIADGDSYCEFITT